MHVWRLSLPVLALFMVGLVPATSSSTDALSEGQVAVQGQSADVVLITVDTLRADYLSCYGSKRVNTPNLDALAADGVLFDPAYCQVPLTPPSHASILTGTYPPTHGLRDFTSGPLKPGTISLAEILQTKGYQTAAFVSAFVLDQNWGLDRGFDTYYDDFDMSQIEGRNPSSVERSAEETTDLVLSWLKDVKSPFFLWIHLYDPHHDYDPPQPFRNQYQGNLYAGEVAYTDQQIGRLIAALRQSHRYDDALIVATSDHGESLGEHGEHEHGFFLYEAALRIPLIFKLPSRYEIEGTKQSTIAQTVDILPTILQILRLRPEPSWKIEGKGLLSSILNKRKQEGFAYAETLYPQTSFGWSALRVVRQGDYKLIDAPRPELYDLAHDPLELTNLYGSNSSLGNQLQQQLAELEQSFAAPTLGPADSSLDSETVERLSALGYVTAARPVPIRSGEILADPKDKIGVFNQILNGLQASEAGQLQQSNVIFQKVALENPELFIVHHSLGLNYLKLGMPEQALTVLETAHQLNPDFASIDVNRAKALSSLGRLEEATTLLRGVLEREPGQLSAQRLLASLLTRRQEYSEAISIYRNILQKRDDDKQALKYLGITLVESQNYPEGAKVLQRCIDLGVNDALTYNSQGIALDNVERREEAIRAYRAALEIKPDYDQPRLNLAFSLLRAGRKEEAAAEFDKLCSSGSQYCKRYTAQFQKAMQER